MHHQCQNGNVFVCNQNQSNRKLVIVVCAFRDQITKDNTKIVKLVHKLFSLLRTSIVQFVLKRM